MSGRLAKIENEKEFPARERTIATEDYEKYGVEMADILPKYFEAVADHHRSRPRRICCFAMLCAPCISPFASRIWGLYVVCIQVLVVK